jgi:hypothetical protein
MAGNKIAPSTHLKHVNYERSDRYAAIALEPSVQSVYIVSQTKDTLLSFHHRPRDMLAM